MIAAIDHSWIHIRFFSLFKVSGGLLPALPPLTVAAIRCTRYITLNILQLNSRQGSAPVARCASADGIAEDPYQPGQAVGVGIKAEMWKTKHPNLTILETEEDTPVLVCMDGRPCVACVVRVDSSVHPPVAASRQEEHTQENDSEKLIAVAGVGILMSHEEGRYQRCRRGFRIRCILLSLSLCCVRFFLCVDRFFSMDSVVVLCCLQSCAIGAGRSDSVQ